MVLDGVNSIYAYAKAAKPYAPTRTVKNLLQEHGVPPWLRERLPLVYCGERLVAVVGMVNEM